MRRRAFPSVRRGGGGFSSRAAAVAQLRAQCRGNHVCGRGDAYGILRSGITTSGSKPMTGLTKWRNRMVACGFRRPRAVSGYRCGNYKAYRYRCFLGARTSAARFHQKHCFSLVDRDAPPSPHQLSSRLSDA